MLTQYLGEEGFDVDVAGGSSQMRARMAGSKFDAVLLDLVLPGDCDGLQLAREIRASSDVPIIMLSGRDDVMDRVVGLEVGADDYIGKPFHLREVLARVRTVLRRRTAPNEAAPRKKTCCASRGGGSMWNGGRYSTPPETKWRCRRASSTCCTCSPLMRGAS